MRVIWLITGGIIIYSEKDFKPIIEVRERLFIVENVTNKCYKRNFNSKPRKLVMAGNTSTSKKPTPCGSWKSEITSDRDDLFY